MTVSEYIVNFLKDKGVSHIFGYQGTMIAYFIDSIYKDGEIRNHCCCNEQGAAFAACGYAKVTGQTGVAYATSGPGAINLLSGIADAYYDSAPAIFITGQLNITEYTTIEELRQQGFQQTDIVSIVKPITKYANMITDPSQIPYELEKSWEIARSGRKGPVLLDLPMDIQKSELYVDTRNHLYDIHFQYDDVNDIAAVLDKEFGKSNHPIFLVGNGITSDPDLRCKMKKIIEKYHVPVITSMLARDFLPTDHVLNFGYLGSAYGHRYANFLACKKADLIVSFGCSMCRRQVGGKVNAFADQAQIIRIDVDQAELQRVVHDDEISFKCDINALINFMQERDIPLKNNDAWLAECNQIKKIMQDFDDQCEERYPNKLMAMLSQKSSIYKTIISDVGQHQVWCAQSFNLNDSQRMLFSGGHGAMGFALPAAIGSYFATNAPVCCISGDGAFQMNIQELQWVANENIPMLILVFDNRSLGLITQQQDDFFDGNHFASTKEYGYSSPDFASIAQAYGIMSKKITVSKHDIDADLLKESLISDEHQLPMLIQINLDENTKAFPKTYFGEEMYNQRPYLPQDVLHKILN